MREQAKRIINTKRVSRPQMSYLWYIEFPFIDGFYGDIFEINSRVASVTLPFPTVEADKQTDGNSFWYFAKSLDIGQINMEVYEHEDGMTLDYFNKWISLIANDNGTFNPPVVYKKDIKFFRLDSQKNKISVDVYKGYFPNGVGDVSNDYESNDFVKYPVSFTGDTVIHINQNNPEIANNREYRTLADITNMVVTAKEFINKVQTARVSAKSLVEILL